MTGINLRRACLHSFEQLAGEDVKDALVYMDAGAGEAFHFLGGLSALLAFGPRAVCSLENVSAKDAEVRLCPVTNNAVEKVLVVTTHLLSYAHQYIHHCLQAHSAIKVITILTSVSEEAHAAHPDTRLGTDAFHEYRRWLMEDHQLLLQKANPDHGERAEPELENLGQAKVAELLDGKTLDLPEQASHADADDHVKADVEEDLEDASVTFHVKIIHFPMIICPLTSRAFVFPSNTMVARAPLAEQNSPMGIGLPYLDGTTNRHDDDGIPIGGTLLAHFLHHLAGQLSLKFDVYTLGPLSNEVGKCLTELSGLADVSVRSRRPAGLLLIDRTLDLITPSSHGDSLLDRIFAFSSRSNEYETKMLKASPKTVARPALDIRVPNTREDLQEIWMPGLQNKELYGLLSKFELKESLFHWNGQKDFDGFKSTDGTIGMLRSFGSSLFDSVKHGENGFLDSLLEKRVSDSLLALEKRLQKAIARENMEPSRGGALTAPKIHSLCNDLSQNLLSAAQHADLIQISKAVEMAIDPTNSSKWDGLLNVEKVLQMSVGDSSQSVASQLCDVVYQSIDKKDSRNEGLPQSQTRRLFTLRDALTLAIVGYTLAGYGFGSSVFEGPFLRDEEERLKQAVVDAILEGSKEDLGFLQGLQDSLAVHKQPNSSEVSAVLEPLGAEAVNKKNEEEVELDFGNEGWEAWDDDEQDNNTGKDEVHKGDYKRIQLQLQVRDRVEAVFGRLHKVSESRRFLQAKAKTSVFDDYDGFGSATSTRRSLVFKVLMLLFAKADIPGMEHHASFVGRILKSGFGRFGLRQVKPKLSDNKIIMVFVIGGINGVEVCEAKEAQAIYKMEDEVDVLLGGTSFLTPDDVFDLLIGSAT